MIVTFAEAYLRDLYEKGVSSDKKHRYQPAVIKSYKKGIEFLKIASRKEDLFPIKSLNFEALQGEKAGLFSIRAGLKYRMSFL